MSVSWEESVGQMYISFTVPKKEKLWIKEECLVVKGCKTVSSLYMSF